MNPTNSKPHTELLSPKKAGSAIVYNSRSHPRRSMSAQDVSCMNTSLNLEGVTALLASSEANTSNGGLENHSGTNLRKGGSSITLGLPTRDKKSIGTTSSTKDSSHHELKSSAGSPHGSPSLMNRLSLNDVKFNPGSPGKLLWKCLRPALTTIYYQHRYRPAG